MNPIPQLSPSPRLRWPLAFAVGAVVRQKLSPGIAGTIVRFSGIPGLWYVQWTDGTCRLCSGAFLEEIPAREWEPVAIDPTL
ncbi:hypothetical protein [Horticoccus sp. 23ND18S-11]|uniref:hypothetical protein n=1 Tax=Horticoccus sp. 23ND18S-11 TaxID=3391832 RepID=UPI0039C9E53C